MRIRVGKMEDYIPQDEYFEWEDIMQSRSYDSTTYVDYSSSLSFSSQYRTSASEKQPSIEIKDFQWTGIDYDGRKTGEFAMVVEAVSQSADETMLEENLNTMEIPSFEDMEYDTEEDKTSRSRVYSLAEETRDDIEIVEHASRNVDYLSHRWEEKDVWHTRKYLRLTMQEHENIARWENAFWRSSAMARLRLPPVSPLSFNWMRDQDDTWLYGPFKSISEECKTVASNELPVNSILKDPCLSEILLRGSITSCYPRKQLSLRRPKERTNIRFSEEVEQYCVVESTGLEWAREDEEESIWMAPRQKMPTQNTVRRLPSTTLNYEPSRKASPAPRTPFVGEESSLRSSSMVSGWMWLSGDEDEDELDWITAAADRTSAALKAASEPSPVFEELAIRESNTKFQTFSGIQFPRPPSSSNEGDDMETEYLLACDHLEMETMTPDNSDCPSSSSSDDQDEDADDYFERNGLLDRKNTMPNTMPKIEVVVEEDKALHEQMEEFNLILG